MGFQWEFPMLSLHLLLSSLWSTLLPYTAALLIVFLLPGPDMALVLQTSATGGARRGLVVAAGLATARSMHVILSACGVAALLRGAPALYQAVRLGGALYLGYVAWQILRSPGFAMPADGRAAAKPARLLAVFSKGLLSNLMNPKALLFCSVLMPQFIHPEMGAVALQVTALGILLVAVGFLLDMVYAFGASRLSNWLLRHPLAQTLQRWTFSLALVGFALRLSLD